MSPPPAPSPTDPQDYQGLARDGAVASILGGLAMTARLLLSTEPVSIGWVIRRVCAAGITAALAGYALADHIASPGLKMATIGAIGYCSPEGVDYLLRWFKAKGEAKVAEATKGIRNAKPSKSKSGAKRR